jgi:hypothetical protein
MHDVAILLLGVIVGLGLGVVISALRRTPVVGGPPPMTNEIRESRSEDGIDAGVEATASAAIEPIPTADAGATPTPSDGLSWLPTAIPGQKKLRFTKTFVKHRIETRVEPGGMSVTVDGTTYHGIDEIPDPETREHVRQTLGELSANVTDPVLKAKVEGELEALGITPERPT